MRNLKVEGKPAGESCFPKPEEKNGSNAQSKPCASSAVRSHPGLTLKRWSGSRRTRISSTS